MLEALQNLWTAPLARAQAWQAGLEPLRLPRMGTAQTKKETRISGKAPARNCKTRKLFSPRSWIWKTLILALTPGDDLNDVG